MLEVNSTCGCLERNLDCDLTLEVRCCCCLSCLSACLVAALTILCFLYILMRAFGVGFLPLLRISSQSLALCSELEHLEHKFLTLSGYFQMSWRSLRVDESSIAACISSSD